VGIEIKNVSLWQICTFLKPVIVNLK
jgi:hypothetical protein